MTIIQFTPYQLDGSDSNSLSQESLADKPGASSSKHLPRRTSEWEILEGLKDGQRYEKKPEPFKGYLQKKRKWPLKGWHKRFFILETGILKYGKSPQDLSKGKIHGQVDIGLSVISTKSKRKRIDIDTEEFIYHLKAKQYEVFEEWMEQLKNHRLYRQHLLTFGSRITSTDDDEIPLKQPLTRKLANEGSPAQRLQWVFDGPLQVAMTELNHTQQALNQLSKILDNMEHGNPDSESIIEGFSPNVKKDRKRFGLRKKKSNKGSSVDLTSFNRDEHNPQTLSPGGSISNRPLSGEQNPGAVLPIVDLSSASDFYILAKDICTSLKSVIYTLQTEKEKLKGSSDEKLRNLLSTMVQQNTELRTRLSQVHKQSDTSDIPDGIQTRSLKSSLSYSSCASEYLDAKESLDQSETSSPAVSSEDLSDSSAVSDLADSEYNATIDFPSTVNETANLTGRRSTLPVPRPNTEGLSLWNLLSRNIGKDLSQVSMPVALNEPLSMLQRMCEELEYSELLDKASELSDPFERMVYVAAFAVSAYGSSYFRAGSKPFNPLLGETYECIREDKGFRFIAEQVSHHPPISVCHAMSKNFTFCENARIKTKFWGRSMEFQPIGVITVNLERPNGSGQDVYKWNKVTTCVHNLFGGQRWVDQYGELVITTSGITCKLTFVKVSYWSSKKHEVLGTVLDEKENRVVHRLFGKWSEALYCGVAPSAKCIWRQGTMPPDYELYYGFTRFAMELNELQPDMVNYLPITDTRFRPDQRLLEEGKIEEAEKVKLQLEQSQRERRKRNEAEGKAHLPKWFK
nr:oxysterol-binding protein-related protein 6-like [Halyomorpha halys]